MIDDKRSAADPFQGILADTWWFGLTGRLDGGRFDDLARLRAAQGFNAIQLVVGIPPEVGPLNENARSEVGFPWQLDGAINDGYLALARERIKRLNAFGLRAVVYGAWGHQIAWLGPDGMARWWSGVVEAVGDLDVIFCLTGELNLWIGVENRLLPDRTTGNLAGAGVAKRLPGRLRRLARRFYTRASASHAPQPGITRRAAWESVLDRLAAMTDRPIIIHTQPGETAVEAVDNSHLLAANTTQTGHSEDQRNALWQIPLHEKQGAPGRPFVNLEPWYEGILGRFGAADQLYAYWASMLAGASGFCYGAHGIWNVGDGRFLAHWGEQTFDQAAALDTPRLIGLSHRLWRRFEGPSEPFHEMREGRLSMIGRRSTSWDISFYPDAGSVTTIPSGRIWLPLAGAFAEAWPRDGLAVVINAPAA